MGGVGYDSILDNLKRQNGKTEGSKEKRHN